MNNKFSMVFFLVGMLVAIPSFVLASGDRQDQVSNWKMETQGWSIEDHMAAAKAEEEEVQSLESRVQQMEKRIANLEKKPYFDPKGINKSALKLLSGNLKGKMNLMNEKVAWHYRQADQAQLTE
ncbi:MAG: hypothetical protein KC592_02490 [Nitrospira sp.]|nr:hypothetical protein [Nitrospira sp.]HNP29845.1 hypothetical protein [Nitrospirales bacterium]